MVNSCLRCQSIVQACVGLEYLLYFLFWCRYPFGDKRFFPSLFYKDKPIVETTGPFR